MTIYTKKDVNGKVLGYYFNAYYKDAFGNRKRKHSGLYNKKKDCEQAEREFKNNISSGNIETNCTLDDLFDLFIKEKEKICGLGRVNTYKLQYKIYIHPICGSMKLKDITPNVCRTWFDNVCSLDTIKISYKNAIKLIFKSLLQYGVDYELIQRNPMLVVKNLKETKRLLDEDDDVENNIITEEEFLNAIGSMDISKYAYYDYYVMLYTLFYTGLRIGELKALTPNDINFEKNYINVNKSYSTVSKTVTKPKTNTSVRKVYIDNKLKNLLLEYDNKNKQKHGYNDNKYFFGGKRTIPTQSLRQAFDKCLKDTNTKRITIHGLRHCRASFLICGTKDIAPFNIAFVSQQLGHANVAITLRVYTSLMKDTELLEMDRIIKSRV